MPEITAHRTALMLGLLVTFLWSTSWVLIRWGLDQEALRPLGFAALRYGAAALILLGWVLGNRQHRRAITQLSRGDLSSIAVLGAVFYALTQGAQFVAIDSQPAATTSVLLSWTPLLVALVGARSIAEGSTGRQLLGAALVGMGALAYFAGELGATPVGVAASLVGLAANTAGALLGRRLNREVVAPAVVITALSMLVGAGLLVVAGLAAEGVPTVGARGWGIVLWLAGVNTALAFSLWNRSLQGLTALQSAAMNNTMVVQIAILGWVFLGEPLGFAEVSGILLVSLGVFLAQAGGGGATLRRPGEETTSVS